ncbi:3-hydroxyacyl-CoA dehydrogenase NAD-binding domain-containing protein [Sphingosinithalassobacter sp. CS137]|uniref:3-hydroxyacyl-CoA dehydrogenase NAD-binding domain-containing protein n=1 Tax=Sphingosinithalassobacter sp. CS137 TaxID=2762748 RepID=UPI00165DC34D|nr:3-hydroxyacyl-CoA dehydrogenase NAD-binding domain-containing protein [Sphingosinithalassobacter sp. CS137]
MELNPVARLEIDDGVAVLTLDSPPVNALSADVREGLQLGFESALADPQVRAIVLACAGRTFIAGADIREFDDPSPRGPNLHQVQALIESSPKPTVAALHGTALGGGLEVALVCHFRVAVPSAKLGLPEVALGLLPGAGGTQRLPRITGAATTLEMIALGRPVSASKAHATGLVDEIVAEGALVEQAVAFARAAADENRPLIRVRDRTEGLELESGPELFAAFRQKHARAFRGLKAPENIIRTIEAAVTLPFDEGMKREAALFAELFSSREAAAQRYLFFAEREAAKVPDIPRNTQQIDVRTVGVIGAGTMGGGIAMNFLNAGMPVTLVEARQDALDLGVATIRRNYQVTVDKGRMKPEQLERCMALLTPTLAMEDLGDADLIIEAVFEKLELKQEIFGKLDGIAKPDAVLATNTSFLDVDAIAASTKRPDHVVGMHFFSPANVMKLLEVVRGKLTAPEVVATAMGIGRRIGKVAVLSRVCDGFIANRMMAPRMAAAEALLLEGPMPWDVDAAIVDYGFAMGPFAMLDLVGLDVIGWDAATSSGSTVVEVLCEMDRWGQKKQGGFYDYDEQRRATPSEVAEKVIRDFQAKSGSAPRRFAAQEIVERLLFPVVNEGAKLLGEGIPIRASDVDIALVYGYGWPVYTGGPLFWADTVGLDRVIAGLRETGRTPAPLLVELAEKGQPLHQVRNAG